MVGENRKKRELCAAVSFAERMDGVQLREKMRGTFCKCPRFKTSQISPLSQVRKKPTHFAVDVLRVAKVASFFRHPHCPDLARPRIHVLEKMSVNAAIMAVAEPPPRQRLRSSLRSYFSFESVKDCLVANVEKIDKNAYTWIAIWIGLSPVHPSASASTIGTNDAVPALFSRQTATIEFGRALFHTGTKLNAFDRADFSKTFAAEDYARRSGSIAIGH